MLQIIKEQKCVVRCDRSSSVITVCQEIISEPQSLTFDQIFTSQIDSVLCINQTLPEYSYNASELYSFSSKIIPKSSTFETVFLKLSYIFCL